MGLGVQIHFCSQWVPPNPTRCGRKQLASGFIDRTSDRKPDNRGEPKKQPQAAEVGQGRGQSLEGQGRARRADGRAHSSEPPVPVGGGGSWSQEKLTQKSGLCVLFHCGPPALGVSVIGKVCVGFSQTLGQCRGTQVRAHTLLIP